MFFSVSRPVTVLPSGTINMNRKWCCNSSASVSAHLNAPVKDIELSIMAITGLVGVLMLIQYVFLRDLIFETD